VARRDGTPGFGQPVEVTSEKLKACISGLKRSV
jgi:hypothetical protein